MHHQDVEGKETGGHCRCRVCAPVRNSACPQTAGRRRGAGASSRALATRDTQRVPNEHGLRGRAGEQIRCEEVRGAAGPLVARGPLAHPRTETPGQSVEASKLCGGALGRSCAGQRTARAVVAVPGRALAADAPAGARRAARHAHRGCGAGQAARARHAALRHHVRHRVHQRLRCPVRALEPPFCCMCGRGARSVIFSVSRAAVVLETNGNVTSQLGQPRCASPRSRSGVLHADMRCSHCMATDESSTARSPKP